MCVGKGRVRILNRIIQTCSTYILSAIVLLAISIITIRSLIIEMIPLHRLEHELLDLINGKVRIIQQAYRTYGRIMYSAAR